MEVLRQRISFSFLATMHVRRIEDGTRGWSSSYIMDDIDRLVLQVVKVAVFTLNLYPNLQDEIVR